MKTLTLILLLIGSKLLAAEVKVRVVDETGAPVSGAETKIIFVDYRSKSAVCAGNSDRNGRFDAHGNGTHSVMVKVAKKGHYFAQLEGLSRDKDHDVEVVLPRVLNPTPLYAIRKIYPKFPVQNQWVGFDFEAADWVAPHGKGKTADLLFRFKNEFKGWRDGIEKELDQLIAESRDLAKIRKDEWTMERFKTMAGKWDGEMQISFPGGGEGLLEERRFLSYSRLKMPHAAPADGYVSTWLYEASSYHYPITRENVGFFLRTRVKRDGQGKIISANYAKVIGDFQLTASEGNVTFTYYFNPVPNDRNLEFSQDNLMKEPKHGGYIFNISP
jgi:hypothetical protein